MFTNCVNRAPNHAVTIVGWGKNPDHFIIKNSWGEGWGDSGYARVAANCNNLGDYANYMIYTDGGKLPDPPEPPDPDMNLCIGEDTAISKRSFPIEITITNRTQTAVDIFWIDYKGDRQYIVGLNPWQSRRLKTQQKHPFVALEKETRNCLELWQSDGKNYWGIQ